MQQNAVNDQMKKIDENYKEKLKTAVLDQKYDNIFNEEFVKVCLLQQGIISDNNDLNDRSLNRTVGLAVLKNVFKLLEKLQMMNQNDPDHVINSQQLLRAMGLSGLNFLQPEDSEQILK